MLSEWNTLLEAAEWLSETTEQSWTWRNVIEAFLRICPDTVHVIIEPNTSFYYHGKKFDVDSPGFVFKHTAAPEETVNNTPLLIKSCEVEHFLKTILLSKDYESACGYAARFVNGEVGEDRNNYRMIDPVSATAIRLKRIEVMGLLSDPVWGLPPDYFDSSDEASPPSEDCHDTKSAEAGTNGRNTIASETRCKEWLINLMRDDSRPDKSKPEYRDEAKKFFSGLSVRGFDRAWANAMEETGNANWKKPGPKS